MPDTEQHQPLWSPPPQRIAASHVEAFRHWVNDRHGLQLQTYQDMLDWSVAEQAQFWDAVWETSGVIAEHKGERVLIDAGRMPGARFFPDARLNFAQNLLRRNDDAVALHFWGEDQVQRSLSWRELHTEVSRLQQALAHWGVQAGDRVAAYMPNMPETVIAMLAATSLGATFTSASPDFGVQGVLDRFGQTQPKVLIACDGYFYNGKTFSNLGKLAELVPQLPSVVTTVVVPYVAQAKGQQLDVGIVGAQVWESALEAFQPRAVQFAPQPFDHPVYILYSSGTTGAPKCIVHRAGGVLLKHLAELRLQVDIHPEDRVFFFTTCGWMMWNWLMSALSQGATVCLYDGSPGLRDNAILFDYADAVDFTHLGTSAKFIEALGKSGIAPMQTHWLSALRTLMSTGSPLAPEGFDYVYGKVKSDLCLSSLSGGTDLVACFIAGSPMNPVWRGEIQACALGMAVIVADDDGKPLPDGQKGELVCVKPFPSMPLGFLVDGSLELGAQKYHDAYFAQFPNVWWHGDYIERTAHGGYIIFGRSDATLNPGGVRIGTAEIYRQVERIEAVLESIVIGQNWPPGTYGDVRVVLFVRLRDGVMLDDALIDAIKRQIRNNTTPRHVPTRIVQVHDIPRTKSNKIVEIAVRNLIHGDPVKNVSALANPEALDEYRALRAELERA
ncbi:acetoacetate--CoA ligase [Thiomonas intermedia]|uniref:acetoacetate--CoA ligase n=1 Tax=Thiomonas intermedia TaxID=926 RepID=UPI0009A52A55|nr:acetoacetate--CoA ligase [Thiomonas intermedia]